MFNNIFNNKKETQKETEEEKNISKLMQDMTDSKMVNTQIQTWFDKTMEVMKDIDVSKEYISAPILNDDISNFKLVSYIYSKSPYAYYCQGFIEKDYNYKTLPNELYYDPAETVKPDFTLINQMNIPLVLFKEKKL